MTQAGIKHKRFALIGEIEQAEKWSYSTSRLMQLEEELQLLQNKCSHPKRRWVKGLNEGGHYCPDCGWTTYRGW
ncbi:MAG: hypothetical protein LBG59_06945 [Candidatus Peribacteria bacterium]|jgi:hypothetical protein|nr:hypothetical protein [Candidatus Peribacteria bacterium]